MAIVIVTAHDAKYAEMASITMPPLKDYAAKHGYGFFYDPTVPSVEADACKIRIYHELYMSGRFQADDVFMWVDTDAIITNSDIKVEPILADLMGDAHVMFGSDFNGINTGIYFARFTSKADHYLRTSSALGAAMGWADIPPLFQNYLQPLFQPWIRIVAGKRFNAYPYHLYGIDHWAHKNEVNNWEPGDFICHLPGIEQATRIELLRQLKCAAV